MREFLELVHSAGKIAFSKDLQEIKSFVEQVGTNRIIKDKNLVLEFHQPFSLLLENKRLSEGVLKKEKGAKKEGDAALLATSPVVWELQTNCRPIVNRHRAFSEFRAVFGYLSFLSH